MHNSKYQCHTAAYASHVPTGQLTSSPSCYTEAIQKAYLLTKNIEEFFWKMLGKWVIIRKKDKERARG